MRGGMSAAAANMKRLYIKATLRENARGAVRTTIELLGIAAQMTQSVPYLGAISAVLTEFKRIQDDVGQFMDEFKAAMDDAEEINTLIMKFRERCTASGRDESILNQALCETFSGLERIVLRCVTVIQENKVDSKRKRDRLRLYWRRAELLKSAQSCAADMSKALQRFDRTLNIESAFVLKDVEVKVNRIYAKWQNLDVPQSLANDIRPPTWRLRAPPRIFYGRENELQHAVDLVVRQAPARIAILGCCGIGKTSIALSVLHHSNVESLYGYRRCFVSCEAATTADGVVRVLAEALSFEASPNASSAASVQHDMLHYLRSTAGIICLDNFETPWEADTAAVEVLLSELSHLPYIALIITSRVMDKPLIRWSEPPLKTIMPVSQEAALQTWEAICGCHDEYAVKLAMAVDSVPLGVTLLARLARNESAESVWARWEDERTDLVQSCGTGHRLNNINVSITLSLRALSYRESIAVLGILSIFPTGLPDEAISMLERTLRGHLFIRRALSDLVHFSLVYAEEWGPQSHMIRILSPIRHHILRYHRISDELFLRLTDMPAAFYGWHMDAYLEAAWDRDDLCQARCLSLLVVNPRQARNVDAILRALRVAGAIRPDLQSGLCRRLCYLLVEHREYERARFYISQAITLDDASGDRRDLFADWVLWVRCFWSEFWHHEDDCHYLDEVQQAIRKAWELGSDENHIWDQDFDSYDWLALAQHCVNEGRRKLGVPILRRSGLYTGNESSVFLGYSAVKTTYDRLVSDSCPPWDLPGILKSLDMQLT